MSVRYIYSNNGLSMASKTADYVLEDGEVELDHEATEAELAAAFTGYASAVKQQKITKLNNAYQEKFNALSLKFAAAYLNDGTNTTTKQETLQTQYQALVTTKATERSVILNG